MLWNLYRGEMTGLWHLEISQLLNLEETCKTTCMYVWVIFTPDSRQYTGQNCPGSFLPTSLFYLYSWCAPPLWTLYFWDYSFFKKNYWILLHHLLRYCFSFMFWSFGQEACGILVLNQGSDLHPSCWKVKSTTGPPGKFHFTVVWICISLVFSNVKHCFMCSLDICMSSLEKCFFRSCAHFLNGSMFCCSMSYLHH